MQPAQRVAVNTGLLYARMAITVFISLYATRLVLTALGAEDFGLFNLVGGAIAMLGFLNASMSAATQRFMSFARGAGDIARLKHIFNVSLVLHLVIAGVLLGLLELAGYFFFNDVFNIPSDRLPVAKMIYQLIVVTTLFTVISVPYDAVINAHENMLFITVLGIIEAVFKLGIAFYISHLAEDKLTFYGILTSILSLFLLFLRFAYCHRKYSECKILFQATGNRRLIKEMTTFAGWSFLGSFTSLFANYGQSIVINIFFGTIANAAQGVAGQVSGQLGVFASTILKALNPVIAKSEGAGDRSLMIKASLMGSKVSFFLLMLFYVPALVEMPYILKLWLKNVPPFVLIFCQLLLIRNLIEQLFFTLSASIAAVGNIRNYQITTSILNLFPLVITYLLYLKGFPVHTLYVVYIIYAVIVSINTLYYSHRCFDLSMTFFLKEVIVRCLACFVIGMTVSSFPRSALPEGFPRLMLVVFTSTLVFLLSVWNVGLAKNERTVLIAGLNGLLLKRKGLIGLIRFKLS